ncbi:MAG: right-handed parallel beta-helix repeat-containing protein [Terriglobia bacterium]
MISFSSNAQWVEEGSEDNSPAQTSVFRNAGRKLRIACGLLVSFLTIYSSSGYAWTNCVFKFTGTTMKLTADCSTDASIYVPQGLTLDGAGHMITAVDPVGGGHFLGAVVRNAGTRANVVNLTIKAFNLQDTPCDFGAEAFGEDRLRGIFLYGASGLISNNRIIGLNQGPGSTCNEGTAILALNYPLDGTHPNTVQVTVLGNEIVAAQTFGVAIEGDIAFTVSGNKIGLSDQVGPFLQQFGIFLEFGAGGTALLNNIQGGYSDLKTFIPYGIYVYEDSNLIVSGNAISGVKEGIFLDSQGIVNGVIGTNNNRVQANLITGAYEGIVVVARSSSSSTNNPHADRNNVSANIIKSATGTTALTGIFYGVEQFIPGPPPFPFTPVADGNIIKNNFISGYINPLFDASSTNSVVTGNVIK